MPDGKGGQRAKDGTGSTKKYGIRSKCCIASKLNEINKCIMVKKRSLGNIDKLFGDTGPQQ